MTGSPASPRAVIGVVIVLVTVGALLLGADEREFPGLHTILDTCIALLSGVLGLLFWEMGVRVKNPIPKWLGISFGAAFLLEFIHVLAVVEWSGPLAFLNLLRGQTRPITWPPAAHVLPIGILAIVWMVHHQRIEVRSFAAFMAFVVVAVTALFHTCPFM